MAKGSEESSKSEDANLIDISKEFDAIIVGAGAAGIGVGIALEHAGVENFLIVDRDTVGSSFTCLLYTSPSPRDGLLSRMPSSA